MKKHVLWLVVLAVAASTVWAITACSDEADGCCEYCECCHGACCRGGDDESARDDGEYDETGWNEYDGFSEAAYDESDWDEFSSDDWTEYDGDTYIDIDLDSQCVYCYVDGELVASANCVSGDIYNSPTPTGTYYVWYKETDSYMMGTYYTAYAIYFNEDIALHDADAWRDEYGGDIYQGDGSHGCVNVPRWFAEIVYEYSEIGTPVYVF